MNLALINIFALTSTAFMLCVAMSIAWLHFGRQQFVLLWAISAAGAVVQWLTTGIALVLWPGYSAPTILTGILVIVNTSLLTLGSLQRSGYALRIGWFFTAAIIAISGVIFVLTIVPHIGMRGFIANIYAAIFLFIAGISLLPRNRKATSPEIVAVMVWIGFAIFEATVAIFSLGIGIDGQGPWANYYRGTIIIGLPAFYAAMGIATVLLLASDLAEKLGALSMRDTLTGTLNRRGLTEAGTVALAKAHQLRTPMMVALFDLDEFKKVISDYSEHIGNMAIVAFSDHVQASVRDVDLFGRLGSDEFCLILFDMDEKSAAKLINAIRADLNSLAIPSAQGLRLSVSIGLARFDTQDVVFSDLLKRADTALQSAKESGRNQLAIAEVPTLSAA